MSHYRDDWTSDRLPKWLPHVQHLIGKPINALEIGAYEGRSTVWMIENILTHPSSQIICLDPFCENAKFNQYADYLPRFVENTHPYRSKIRIIQSFSQDVLPETLLGFVPGKFNLIYVDGSHEPADVISDAILALAVANPGAVIAFDDYGWQDVRTAVDLWLELGRAGDKVQVVLQDYQLLVRVT